MGVLDHRQPVRGIGLQVQHLMLLDEAGETCLLDVLEILRVACLGLPQGQRALEQFVHPALQLAATLLGIAQSREGGAAPDAGVKS